MANVVTDFISKVGKAVSNLVNKPAIVIPKITDMVNDMADKQRLWKQMYTNNAPWLTRNVRSLNIAASIAAEISRLITIDVESHVDNEELDVIYQREVMKNLRNQVEYGLALGGFIMKPYVMNNTIRVDFAQPDEYQIIAAASDGTIIEIFFKDYVTYQKSHYVRVEYHKWNEATKEYYINNKVYKSDDKGAIGSEVFDYSFIPQWATMEPEFNLINIEGPLFGYFKPAVSNNVNTKSSQGVSIYARAEESIKDADEQMAALRRELRVKEAKQYVSSLAVGKGATPLPYLEDDFYIKLNTMGGKSSSGEVFFESYSPELHVTQYLEVLDESKRHVEDSIGLAHGTISDPDRVQRTASEVKQTKIRTSVLVSENQEALDVAFKDTVYGIAVWLKYPSKPTTFIINTEWDDSTWMSWDELIASMAEDVAAGLLKPEIYMSKKYGVSVEDAAEMMQGSESLLRGTPAVERR